MAPRTFAERPKSPLVSPHSQSANDNEPVLGTWANGQFRFTSPQAQEKWRRKSYEQGVGEDTWHLGKEMDPKSAGIVQAGLGGANSGLYQGPDGKYRLMTPKTIESQSARDHRNKYLTGKTIDQLAAAKAMPGVEEWVEQGKVAQAKIAQGAANNNAVEKPLMQPVQRMAGPPSDAAQLPTLKTLSPKDQQAGQMLAGRFGAMKSALESSDKQIADEAQAAEASIEKSWDSNQQTGQMLAGRFGAMKSALESSDKKSADDIGRIAVNAVLGNYGDEARAAVASIGPWWDGKSFGESYDSRLQAEKAETLAAQERQGLVGTGTEFATGFIPLIGDISGALADFKDWKENGDDWGWTDYGLVVAGWLPWMVNRRVAKKGKKALDDILDDGKIVDKGDTLDPLKKSSVEKSNLHQLLPSNETIVLTQRQAERLTGQNRGLIYLTETFTGKEAAKTFHDGTSGAFSSVEHQKRAVPALRYDNADGKNFIKFDGLEIAEDGTQLLLIDAKRSLPFWKPSAMNDLKHTLERIKKAVHQNNTSGLDGVKYKVVYEFPNKFTAQVAAMFLASSGYSDLISVRVR